MRKWTSYVMMGLLFLVINLFLTYFKEGYWNFKDGFMIAGLFLIFLLILDSISVYLKKRKHTGQ